jgi:Matrixin
MRLDPTRLPLTINPGDAAHLQIVQKSVDLWNRGGLGTLFAVTSGPADITVDWTGRSVSPGARAETRMSTSSNLVVPSGISVKQGDRSPYDLARVMTHELGHVLGLDHSHSKGDIMFRSEAPGGDLVLSDRDLQMLKWLYSQNNYVPVVGSTSQPTGQASFALQPQSFCGCNN